MANPKPQKSTQTITNSKILFNWKKIYWSWHKCWRCCQISQNVWKHRRTNFVNISRGNLCFSNKKTKHENIIVRMNIVHKLKNIGLSWIIGGVQNKTIQHIKFHFRKNNVSSVLICHKFANLNSNYVWKSKTNQKYMNPNFSFPTIFCWFQSVGSRFNLLIIQLCQRSRSGSGCIVKTCFCSRNDETWSKCVENYSPSSENQSKKCLFSQKFQHISCLFLFFFFEKDSTSIVDILLWSRNNSKKCSLNEKYFVLTHKKINNLK